MIDTLSDSTVCIRGERVVGKHTDGSESLNPTAVAQLAYQFYLMRGRQDGHDLEDWLSAERELTEHYRWLKTA